MALVHLTILTTNIFVLLHTAVLLGDLNQSTGVTGSQENSEVNTGGANNIIRLLTILPYPVSPNDSNSVQPLWDEGPAVLLAAKLAVKHINEDSCTLPGYRLELLNTDGGCNIYSKALIEFTKQLQRGPPIAGIIGPGCSESSSVVSSLMSRPEIHLPNIHFATSPLLEDRNKYRNSYGIVGSSVAYIEAAILLMEYNNWEDVAILFDSDSYIHLNQRQRGAVSQILESDRVVFFSVVYDTYIPLDALVKNSVKVIITLTQLDQTLRILCIAHKRGMVFPRYQWVLSGRYFLEIKASITNSVVFHYDGEIYNCTSKETLSDGHLLLNHRLENRDKTSQLVSGYTFDDIVHQYLLEIYNHNRDSLVSIEPSIWATVAYDSVWAMTLAINMSIDVNISENIKHFQFGNKDFINKIIQQLDEITFVGASGEITFDSKSGFIDRTMDIFYVNGTANADLVACIKKGEISILTDKPQVIFINTNTTRIVTVETVHLTLALLFLFVIFALCIATFLVHILSVAKRRHPSVKASSLVLNHFVFFGCYVWTAGSVIYIVILKTLSYEDESTYANCCQAVWAWLLPIGCTLTFGTLTVKTWRIYRIFIHFRDPGHLISNQVLITLVLVQLSFDIVLATMWSIISPAYLNKTDVEQSMNEENPLMTYNNIIRRRTCIFIDDNGAMHIFWIVISYSYKTIQILMLLFLTVLTRNIPNKKFSTFPLRQASYLAFVLFVSILPPFTVLWYFNAEIYADFILLCTLIIGTVSICFIFIFLLPVLPILKKFCADFKKLF